MSPINKSNSEKNRTIKAVFVEAYGILNFTSAQKEKALGEIAGLQQLAIAREMVKDLAKDELDVLGKILAKNEDEIKQEEIDAILKKHSPSKDLEFNVKLAIERVLRDHTAFLKTQGNAEQKAKIAALLTNI
ncbi:MAG: hypothetical protein WCX69_03600 [Candidatus Paceibacterota bacterium]